MRTGVDTVDPARLIQQAAGRLDPRVLSAGRPVVAAGKAAWPMFRALADRVSVRSAVIAGPAAHDAAPHVEVFAAGHPAPNEASVAAGERALSLARASATQGGLLVLLSGGASAMLVAPAHGVSLGAKMDVARRLMAAGAPIHELNCVRKHLSRIKGGRLAAAAGRTMTLALSDVPGPVPDDPSVIGSGPTVPDPTTFADALEIIRARKVEAPAEIVAHLERGARGLEEETIKPGDPRLEGSEYLVIGSRSTAVDGAAAGARERGYTVLTIDAATSGEAREAGSSFVAEARRRAAGVPRPVCVIGSGETTVTVRGEGLGGRNQEFALGAAASLAALGEPAALASAGTDGIDGPTDAAGAAVDTTTLDRAKGADLDPEAVLAANDTYHFFRALGDLIVWGPTGTNVGDLHVLLIG